MTYAHYEIRFKCTPKLKHEIHIMQKKHVLKQCIQFLEEEKYEQKYLIIHMNKNTKYHHTYE